MINLNSAKLSEVNKTSGKCWENILSLHYTFNDNGMLLVRFVIRPSKKFPEKKTSIYVRVTNGRKYDYIIRTGWNILPKYFDTKNQTIKDSAKFSDD